MNNELPEEVRTLHKTLTPTYISIVKTLGIDYSNCGVFNVIDNALAGRPITSPNVSLLVDMMLSLEETRQSKIILLGVLLVSSTDLSISKVINPRRVYSPEAIDSLNKVAECDFFTSVKDTLLTIAGKKAPNSL